MAKATLKQLREFEKNIDAVLAGRNPASSDLEPAVQLLISQYRAKIYYYNAYQHDLKNLYPDKYDPGYLERYIPTHKGVQLLLDVPQPRSRPLPRGFFSSRSNIIKQEDDFINREDYNTLFDVDSCLETGGI